MGTRVEEPPSVVHRRIWADWLIMAKPCNQSTPLIMASISTLLPKNRTSYHFQFQAFLLLIWSCWLGRYELHDLCNLRMLLPPTRIHNLSGTLFLGWFLSNHSRKRVSFLNNKTGQCRVRSFSRGPCTSPWTLSSFADLNQNCRSNINPL